jgi:hypothetical protein
MAEPPSVQTFVNLMAIEALSEGKDENVKRYMSKRPSFNPGGGSAYGGHVFAQAVWAASQDVKEGLVVHVWAPCNCHIDVDPIPTFGCPKVAWTMVN